MDILLAELQYELISAADHAEKPIRDVKGQPILNAAIVHAVDMIQTGDKDFLCLDLERPKCLSVAQYLEDDGLPEQKLYKHIKTKNFYTTIPFEP